MNYYRLIHIDNVGKESYSEVAKIYFAENNNAIMLISNPITNNELLIQIREADNINIFNLNGQQFLQKHLNAGLNAVNVSQLTPGQYYLQSGRTTFKIIIQ